jgi:hypothetical protein
MLFMKKNCSDANEPNPYNRQNERRIHLDLGVSGKEPKESIDAASIKPSENPSNNRNDSVDVW